MDFALAFWPWLDNYLMSQKSRMDCEGVRSFPNTAYWSISPHSPLAYTNKPVIVSLELLTFLSIIMFMWWKWLSDHRRRVVTQVGGESETSWRKKRSGGSMGLVSEAAEDYTLSYKLQYPLRTDWLQLEFGLSTSTKICIICNAEFSLNLCFKAITEDG
jgi:hypothetical protein